MLSLANTKILVVGGAGFVGSNLVKTLLKSPVRQVIVVDNLLSAEASNLPDDERLQFIQGGIQEDLILNQINDDFEFIFHLSTFHGNQSSIHDPLKDHENNLLTSIKLFHHIQHFKTLKKLVYASAGCVVAKKTFDDVEATSEDAPISPYMDSPYQISKMVGEFYGNFFWKHTGMPFIKARFQNVYGPGEILGAGEWRGTPATIWRNVTPTFIYKALKRQALTVDNGGIATRDFIYVQDIVDGLILCALKGEAGDVFNLASGQETSILELANLINQLTKNPTEMDFRPKRSWDNSGKRYGSTNKAQEKLDFKIKVGLEQGLKTTIQWTRDHLDKIENCMQKHAKHL